MRRALALALGLGLALATGATAAQESTTEQPTLSKADLYAVAGSGVGGVVVLEAAGERTKVSVALIGAAPGAAFSAAVHEGTCADPGRTAFRLGETARAPDGVDRLVATVDASLLSLLDRPHAVRIEAPAGRPVACGELALTTRARAAALRDALAGFMDARLARNGPATLVWVTDALRARAPNGFTGLSNPCLYRYAVERLAQPAPTAAVARVRVYTHWWPGDVAGGPPNSAVEEIDLARTPAGWRVDDVRLVSTWREESGEPHGPHTSACTVGRRPADWLPAALPAAGGLPAGAPLVAGAIGLALVGAGAAVRGYGNLVRPRGARENGS